MKVSVIITTYKRPHYLSEAIGSVLKQSLRDFELIIVDDDPDGKEVEKIILSYRDPRIIYIKNKENFGGAKSLNIGLKRAKGEYIAVLDDDDIWLNINKMEKQVSLLEKRSDYAMIGTGSITVDSNNEKEIIKTTGEQEITNVKEFLFRKSPYFAHSSVLYRRKDALLVGGYDESLPRGKDLDLYFKLGKLGKFGILKEYWVKHRDVFNLERDIIRTRYIDSLFHRKVLWRHRENSFLFWLAYFRISLRCLLFFFLKSLPFPYYIYRRCRYGKFSMAKNN
jgi:glycosyltransferase involved in cell wall biosynthesis